MKDLILPKANATNKGKGKARVLTSDEALKELLEKEKKKKEDEEVKQKKREERERDLKSKKKRLGRKNWGKKTGREEFKEENNET